MPLLPFWGGPIRPEAVPREATPYDLAPTRAYVVGGVSLPDAVRSTRPASRSSCAIVEETLAGRHEG
jgi:hypothetical protein